MKASERLGERNDLLLIIAQIDSELEELSGDKSFRAAKIARDSLEHRAQMVRELNALGFSAPALSERFNRRGEVATTGRRAGCDSASGDGDCDRVAKRRIGPAS